MLQNPFSHRRLHFKLLEKVKSVTLTEPTVTIYDSTPDEGNDEDQEPLDEIGVPPQNTGTRCLYSPIEGAVTATTKRQRIYTYVPPKTVDLFDESNYKIHGRKLTRTVPLSRRRAS